MRSLLQPNCQLLDVGCGTGCFARALQSQIGQSAEITLLDPCTEMLNRTEDIRARRVHGRLEALPFADAEFDLVTCAWALETTTRTSQAVSELVRVAKPGGFVCLVFCADVPFVGLAGKLMRSAVSFRGTGRFLDPGHVETALERTAVDRIIRLPCGGPAVALLIHRPEADLVIAAAA
ncbi:MAG: methyltransferase domain-containing protein [Hyphomicrobiales bacterium]|nr:methyltransferase domain-containing protein [Hyphomicrobiales bacterium]